MDTEKYGIGQAVSRFEDPRLLRGAGRYVNDVSMARQGYAYFLRSPHAHAKIVRVDTAAAKAAPGVLGVFTEADVAAEKLGTTRLALPRKRADGSPAFARPHPGLARGEVRYVGDPVAMVVAETLAQAKDAAELVEVDYEALPAVIDAEDAVKPGAPRVWDENPDNVSHIFETGNKAAADAAFAQAAHVVKRKYVITRVHAQYMEPRGTVGAYDPSDERFTLHADVQYAHRVRDMLAGRRVQDPGDADPRRHRRCRRRLRHQGLAVCRASADPDGGAQARPAGQMELRAQRGAAGRRAWPRRDRRGRAGAGQGL